MRVAMAVLGGSWLALAGRVEAQGVYSSISPSYSDAQAVAAVQAGLTSFSNPNITMPNGANLAHTIYTATSSVVMNGTSDASCFGSTGVGNQTIQPIAMFAGARFRIQCGGTYSTGVASVATLTIKVKWGSTTVTSVTTPALPTSALGLQFFVDVTCTIRSAGATGSMVCVRGTSYSTSGLGVAAIFNPLVTPTAVTIDTTQAAKIDVTGAFSSLVGSPSATSLEASIVQEN